MIDHTGVSVSNFARSKAFYAQALSAIGYGLLMEIPFSVTGRDNGAPGLRPHYHPHYHPDYYGAFVLDPDGHNIEAVCHTAS